MARDVCLVFCQLVCGFNLLRCDRRSYVCDVNGRSFVKNAYKCLVGLHNGLEEGGHFSGIYRKVQLKPSKWVKLLKPNANCEDERPVEALMVLKYGGVLPLVGRKQAEELGRFFRNNIYPDEGRVKMLAATFAKDLDLERQLTPILVSLVSKDSLMLDGLEDANEMEEAKVKLHEIII